jgi:hypothetical protein
MQAAPERAEEIYFAPFSQVLARSGEFAPLFAVCAPGQKPGFPLAGDWTEAEPVGFHFPAGHVFTQPWAKPFVNVSSSMPIVVSAKAGFLGNQLFYTMKFAARPALVFDSPGHSEWTKKAGLIGASFLPVGESSTGRQDAIEAVTSLIDRYSAGR